MEVNDIQSFFLNKDKKKKSKKNNTINPASLLEKTKETENKKSKKVSEKQCQNQEPQSELLRKTKEDEDWEDTCEDEVDLATLRIGMMPAKVVEEIRPKVEVVNEEVSDEEDGDRIDKQAHPWGAKMNSVVQQESEPVEPQPQKTQLYVSPSMRAAGGASGSGKAPKKAPNIGNTAEFPSLREAVDIETEDSSWSRVTKNGHSQSQERPAAVARREQQQAAVTVVTTSASESKQPSSQPGKYVPPYMRNKQNTASRPSDNKYNTLKEESLN